MSWHRPLGSGSGSKADPTMIYLLQQLHKHLGFKPITTVAMHPEQSRMLLKLLEQREEVIK